MAENRPDPRDGILDRFEAGEISKEQADAEAIAAGFTSMEIRPDFTGVDCCELPRWTMPQLMAWVIYRSCNEVVELSEEYRMQSRTWQSEDLLDANGEKIRTTWRLRPPDKLSVYDVVAEALSREGRASNPIQLRAELGGQFLRGELRAYGKKRGDDEPRAIPNTAWNTIDVFDLPCNHFDPEDIGRENEETPRYVGVYVIPQEILSNWPRIASEPGDAQTRAKNTRVPTKPEQLAPALLRRFPDGRPSLSTPELSELLRKEPIEGIGSFSERTLKRAIKQAWPDYSRRGQNRQDG
jgi:hypothetical protein